MRNSRKSILQSAASTAALAAMIGTHGVAAAQTADPGEAIASSETVTGDVENDIVVTGIRQSLASALNEKRNTDNIAEFIQAEDIGKLPDQNLAEVLENITGIQIERSAGVGTGVQIRGTDANRIEINGVSTVGSTSGRSGISFEDLPAALIASVEITKVPEARTIEGSVGGTINLRTIRPLSLKERLVSVRAQGEYSDLSETTLPRLSATIGDRWDTGIGEIGVVLSASYAKSDVTSFDPRVDRDRTVLPNSGRVSAEAFPFLRIQFLDQQLTNQEYETVNFTGALEWKPTDNLRLYFDATINDQNRIQQSARAFFSGVTANAVIDATNNISFETVNLGTVDGPNGLLNLGEIQAAETGVLGVGVTNGSIDANLRMGTQTGSRQTNSSVLAGGLEWSAGRLTVNAEVARSSSKSDFPDFSTEIDFINPNGPQPVVGRSSDNGVPAVFDLRNGTLQFGIAPGLPETPTSAQLLNPANYRLRSVGQAASNKDNSETALRLDLKFDSAEVLPFFSSVDAGYRYNVSKAANLASQLATNFTATSATTFLARPRLDQFASFVVPGPDNFNSADGRELYIGNYLVIDPVASANNAAELIAAINTAIAANNLANGVNLGLVGTPTVTSNSFFDIQEKTNAAYLQGNYDTQIFGMPIRGNLGFRWTQTKITSIGNNVVNGSIAGQVSQSSSYSFFLPRWSLVAEPAKNFLIRAGISRDLRRPDFDDLSISTTFGGSAVAAVRVGNPNLKPETVWSFDIAGEYYFSDTGFVSLGFFHKRRTNLFADSIVFPEERIAAGGQIERDITAPCENGGIYNPFADRNVFSSTPGQGICVPLSSTFNSDGVATQTGLEIAAQYDLSKFEDTLGFASGFGILANFTYQKSGGTISNFYDGSGGANALNELLGRTDRNKSTPTLDDDVVFQRIKLTDLSNYSYNLTAFYDKYGLNMRARYTWRSHFIIGQTERFGLPRVVDDRGQLNASISYAITDRLTAGVDGINLLREDRKEWCINDNALLCQQGVTDRRFVGSISYRF